MRTNWPNSRLVRLLYWVGISWRKQSISNQFLLNHVERLLRHLASNHMLYEPSVGVFKPTPFTKSLLQPVFGEWINHL